MNHLKYTLKVWLTSVFILPLIILLYGVINSHGNIGDAPALAIFEIVIGGISSMPSALLLWLTVYLLSKTTLNCQAQKTVLTFSGVLLTALPFFFITGDLSLDTGVGYVIALYASTIIAGIWLYQLQPPTDDVLQD
jgi:hypothetical protein